MPAGLPYFAWIDASETTFTSGHMRWDEAVFSFTLKQDEGDPASLTAVVRRPVNDAGGAIGLLGPGRKIWCWFALDCGPALIKFRGRLVGIPTSIFEELVTLEFVARPFDVVAQKEALADTLRVLPYYDEAVIDKARRNDPEVVLEGYTAIWHYDRESHVISISDEIVGEDGLVEFDGASTDGKVLYDGLGLTLSSGPLSRVDVSAEYTWTQQATGTVDLTGYLFSHWPGVEGRSIPSLNASDWPKHGSGLGDGWEVASSTAEDVYDFTTHTETRGGGAINKQYDGSTSQIQWSSSTTSVNAPITVIGHEVTNNTYTVNHDTDGDGALNASASASYSETFHVVGVQAITATLMAGYKAQRGYTERVSFSLFADIQSILTDPEDGEALRVDDIRSVNLSEVIDGAAPIIDDPRRRSYIATERGNRSMEHLIALARAHLMKRARVVEIAFAPKLARMPEITLRKNASLIEPRVGEAVGKIIGYSIALDGADGKPNCEVRIGCTIGRGGALVELAGTPTYCSVNYVGADYQQFNNRVVAFAPGDTSVGYQPPNADPNDDGINFLSWPGLTAENVIESGLVVEHGPDPDAIIDNPKDEPDPLAEYETRAKFKLKSVTSDFSTDYQLQVTDLKIPTGYDLETV